MRSKHLTAAGGLGFALGAGAAFLGCSLAGSALPTGSPVDLFVAAATLTGGGGAWGAGRWVAERSAAEAGRSYVDLLDSIVKLGLTYPAQWRVMYGS